MSLDNDNTYKARGLVARLMNGEEAGGKGKDYEVQYDKTLDFVQIWFPEPRDVIYEYPEGSEKGVFIKRDDEGRVAALGIARFSERDGSLSEFLRLFEVELSEIRKALGLE